MGVKSIILLTVFFLLSTIVFAADENDKGFILSAGIGVAPYVHWETKEHVLFFTEVPRDDDVSGLSFDLKCGTSWSSTDQVVLELNGARFHSFEFQDRRAYQFFLGPVFYRFIEISDMKRLGVGGGIGLYGFDLAGFDAFDSGFGWIVAGSYSIFCNLELACSFSGGSTSESGKEMKHTHLSVNINAIMR